MVVAASCGGSDLAPDWWLNLQKQPTAEVQIAGARRIVYARRADPDALRQLETDFTEAFPRFERYQRRTRRKIPLVLLQPAPTAGWANGR
jgi:deazaflavin-dependent oxidoreductase (nitroreductase family)